MKSRSIAFFVGLCAVFMVQNARAASFSTLQHREHRQLRSLHRYQGTVRFFRHHPAPARSLIGRREVRKAHIWIRVIERELQETKVALMPKRVPSSEQFVRHVIEYVFRSAAYAAKTVALCESHFSVTASNGQYWGVFQMGSRERSIYGGSGTNPWEQVRAAYRYYLVRGWSPWECRP